MTEIQFIFTLMTVSCTVIALIISIKSFKNTIKKDNRTDITDEVKRDTAISVKLDMVLQGNTELKNEIKGINHRFEEINERLARVEESSKQAHKRIDNIDKKISGEVLK